MTLQDTDFEHDLVPPERLPYMRGIDGLRAIAVMAVLFYHAGFTWARGGFLGVEVFFVISGYLITSLLLLEWLRTGTIGVKRFWLRRARRLLPAVFLLLGVVSIASMLVYRDTLSRMFGDVVAASGYVTNWLLIFREVSYFETFGRPPLLQHLWSLSVEEQFYVLWPIIFTVGFALLRNKNPRRTIYSFLGLTIAGIIASTILMAVLFTPFEDPSRVYYGTDTRAAGILVGVALALVWIPWRLSSTLSRVRRAALNLGGIAALIALTFVLIFMDEYSTLLYRGGFLITSLLTAAVIAATAHPVGVLGLWLENPVMKWIGTRSYGIYLWHWPIFMVTRPGVDVPGGTTLWFVVRTGLTFAVAEVSYRFVESPIRHKGFRVWVTDIRHAVGIRTVRGGSVVAAGALAAVTLVVGGLVWGSFIRTDPIVVASFAVEDDEPIPAIEDEVGPTSTTATTTTVAPTPTTTEPPPTTTVAEQPASEDLGAITPTTTAPVQPEAEGETPRDPPSVALIGDSVVAGAQGILEQSLPNTLTIDATVNRQFKHADDVVEELRSDIGLPEVVVIHLGTNGAFSDETFDEVMASLEGVERVIVLTAKVPRRWEANVNRAIEVGAERWPDIEVVDWHTIAAQRPDWFNTDQVHLNRDGMIAYAELLDRVING